VAPGPGVVPAGRARSRRRSATARLATGVPAALAKALEVDAGHYRWVAATGGSQGAASLELATGGDPVMAIGGFSNQGGNLTLSAFERYVEEGDIHYYISGGANGGGPGGGSSSSSITAWVESHFCRRDHRRRDRLQPGRPRPRNDDASTPRRHRPTTDPA
jgi:hypothetical protein